MLAVRLVPDPRVHRPHHFDVVGMLLATCGLLGIVYVLIEGPGHGAGTSATVTALSLACLLLFGHIADEVGEDSWNTWCSA